MYPSSIQKLITQFKKLPSVGPRTAERFVFHLLKFSQHQLVEFANALANMKRDLKECARCYNMSDNDLCSICRNTARDARILCVVADIRDLASIEQTSLYHGLYFVLGGNLDTLHGITPDMLHITELVNRILNPNTKPQEIILGFNPNIEGETTALYMKEKLGHFNIKITRLAKGLPTGSDLEYADAQTVGEALLGRREM